MAAQAGVKEPCGLAPAPGRGFPGPWGPVGPPRGGSVGQELSSRGGPAAAYQLFFLSWELVQRHGAGVWFSSSSSL